MKKLLLGTLCGALALTLAVPAMADHTLGGYYRVQFMSVKSDTTKDANADNFVDQRLRAKWTNTLNDYVSVVWYGEVDTPWGEQSKGKVGGGGMFGADGVNIETKHVYATVKVPDTSVVVRAGVQGVADVIESAYIDNDAAALNVSAKFGAADVTLIYSKFAENDRDEGDDTNLYAAAVGFAPSDAVKVKLGAYYAIANSGSSSVDDDTLLTLAASASFAAGPAMIDVGLGSQTGETVVGASTVDSSALMAYVKGAMTLGQFKTFARLTYYSNDDDASDNNRWVNLSAFEFYKDGLMIFGRDVRYNNGPGGAKAFDDAAEAGYGLIGLTLGADTKIADDYALHLGLFTGVALDDELNGASNAATDKEGTSLGTEINCQISRNVGEKANVALRGAYALVGDFYEDANGDADDLYTMSVVLNIGY